MDGLPPAFDSRTLEARLLDRRFGDVAERRSSASGSRQRTLKRPIGCVGIGLHSGRRVELTIAPAPANSGIVFCRTDIGPAPVEIAARFDRVVDTRLCTVLASDIRPEAEVGTVEHLLAALAGSFVDNAVITLDGPEVPVLDGSAAPFLFLLDCAGIVEQEPPRRWIEVLRPIHIIEGEASVALLPATVGAPLGLDMAMTIDFTASAIGHQALALRLDPSSLRHDLAAARTFTLAAEIAHLRATGRALGGSLENAVVVDGAQVLNPGGLRMPDEFVRHKLLDAVGDLALAGAALHGRFVGRCSGHALNNRLLRCLFADPGAWRVVGSPQTPAASRPLVAAA